MLLHDARRDARSEAGTLVLSTIRTGAVGPAQIDEGRELLGGRSRGAAPAPTSCRRRSPTYTCSNRATGADRDAVRRRSPGDRLTGRRAQPSHRRSRAGRPGRAPRAPRTAGARGLPLLPLDPRRLPPSPRPRRAKPGRPTAGARTRPDRPRAPLPRPSARRTGLTEPAVLCLGWDALDRGTGWVRWCRSVRTVWSTGRSRWAAGPLSTEGAVSAGGRVYISDHHCAGTSGPLLHRGCCARSRKSRQVCGRPDSCM